MFREPMCLFFFWKSKLRREKRRSPFVCSYYFWGVCASPGHTYSLRVTIKHTHHPPVCACGETEVRQAVFTRCPFSSGFGWRRGDGGGGGGDGRRYRCSWALLGVPSSASAGAVSDGAGSNCTLSVLMLNVGKDAPSRKVTYTQGDAA